MNDATVFVVDDDPGMREALGRLFRSAGLPTKSFASPLEFLSSPAPGAPGCLVLDLSMPDLDGIEVHQRLNDSGSLLPVIFLTGQPDVPHGIQAMKQGAIDFLTKPVEDEMLLAVVRKALASNAAARAIAAELEEVRRRYESLTPRECEVFAHVAQGEPNKSVARDLGIAEKTVKVHRGRVMEKMQAHSLAELVRMAQRLGV